MSNDMLMRKESSTSQEVMYALNVVISWNWCKIMTLLLQTN